MFLEERQKGVSLNFVFSITFELHKTKLDNKSKSFSATPNFFCVLKELFRDLMYMQLSSKMYFML